MNEEEFLSFLINKLRESVEEEGAAFYRLRPYNNVNSLITKALDEAFPDYKQSREFPEVYRSSIKQLIKTQYLYPVLDPVGSYTFVLTDDAIDQFIKDGLKAKK